MKDHNLWRDYKAGKLEPANGGILDRVPKDWPLLWTEPLRMIDLRRGLRIAAGESLKREFIAPCQEIANLLNAEDGWKPRGGKWTQRHVWTAQNAAIGRGHHSPRPRQADTESTEGRPFVPCTPC